MLDKVDVDGVVVEEERQVRRWMAGEVGREERWERTLFETPGEVGAVFVRDQDRGVEFPVLITGDELPGGKFSPWRNRCRLYRPFSVNRQTQPTRRGRMQHSPSVSASRSA